ncbi:hypothetical protein [Arthrobacter bambusae]|uniref:hypothetical protein n=1 Tax=Arthrobacter bambusae TaxID=1338426 RepID=UPI0027826D47|nr:hypothetical protein [Arthrobacter bambusae]MDQ0239522.1 hypothetical protein [Arthrobacter bambusae]
MTDEIQWLVPPASLSLSGDEPFTGMPGTTVRDFWQFALGDLRMNNARGYLAEFLVGKALGIKDLKRVEWDSYDLLFGDITIEIKSSAYLQSWEQKKISALSFSGLQGTRYHPRAPGDGMDPAGRRFNAMVYVFCAHTETEHAKYDQLNVLQWEFHIVPRSVLAATGLKSLGIAKVRQLSGGPTPWAELASRVTAVAADQRRDDDSPWWTQ